MRILQLVLLFLALASAGHAQPRPAMYFSDSSRLGRPVAKNPCVVRFHNQYLLYYSIPENQTTGWGIGIAASTDLIHWQKVGELTPAASYEQKGLCAPGALVRGDTVHLFYQTYGNGPKDALCHAVSTDGVHFRRDASNPIFRPTGAWTVGRAIDAEVVAFKDQYWLYYATRDPSYKVQLQGAATAPLTTSFGQSAWQQQGQGPILVPSLPWEKNCVEGASCVRRGKYLYLFYAGAYNNEPQQIGVARSRDGLRWQRLATQPLLPNGPAGSWNSSESGHPAIFEDPVSGRTYLFYQGNNDQGRTWYLSRVEVQWKRGRPYLVP
ncbi:family 43 glycosylhydrolase [Hymenobacter sp. YC55]|uniref:family 43 glycosylhydrolase n=1 Tax=Hymenobacter sp. YC55 TaxID=3034019 RepID=UPI0023F80A50|nr:family 43 glycosylhydrolase [Hymenobacter sp. YC55]MDF7813815.1 family 43 glycosylhydrolase [Hymenobacter sp. YC55]